MTLRSGVVTATIKVIAGIYLSEARVDKRWVAVAAEIRRTLFRTRAKWRANTKKIRDMLTKALPPHDIVKLHMKVPDQRSAAVKDKMAADAAYAARVNTAREEKTLVVNRVSARLAALTKYAFPGWEGAAGGGTPKQKKKAAPTHAEQAAGVAAAVPPSDLEVPHAGGQAGGEGGGEGGGEADAMSLWEDNPSLDSPQPSLGAGEGDMASGGNPDDGASHVLGEGEEGGGWEGEGQDNSAVSLRAGSQSTGRAEVLYGSSQGGVSYGGASSAAPFSDDGAAQAWAGELALAHAEAAGRHAAAAAGASELEGLRAQVVSLRTELATNELERGDLRAEVRSLRAEVASLRAQAQHKLVADAAAARLPSPTGDENSEPASQGSSQRTDGHPGGTAAPPPPPVQQGGARKAFVPPTGAGVRATTTKTCGIRRGPPQPLPGPSESSR